MPDQLWPALLHQYDLTDGEAWGGEHPPDCLRQAEGGEALVLDDDKELQEVGPRRNEGSQHRCCKARGGRDQAGHEGATSGGTAASTVGGRGPRMAVASRSARSMPAMEQGADNAIASGDGAAKAPLGA
jgi:hypothetical protein